MRKLPLIAVALALVFGGLNTDKVISELDRFGIDVRPVIDAITNQACAAIEVALSDVDRDFLYWTLAGKYEELRAISEARGGNQSNLNAQLIRDVKITLPDLLTQRAIVAEIEAEQGLVNANRELIRRIEAKVKATIDRVWGSGE